MPSYLQIQAILLHRFDELRRVVCVKNRKEASSRCNPGGTAEFMLRPVGLYLAYFFCKKEKALYAMDRFK